MLVTMSSLYIVPLVHLAKDNCTLLLGHDLDSIHLEVKIEVIKNSVSTSSEIICGTLYNICNRNLSHTCASEEVIHPVSNCVSINKKLG